MSRERGFVKSLDVTKYSVNWGDEGERGEPCQADRRSSCLPDSTTKEMCRYAAAAPGYASRWRFIRSDFVGAAWIACDSANGGVRPS